MIHYLKGILAGAIFISAIESQSQIYHDSIPINHDTIPALRSTWHIHIGPHLAFYDQNFWRDITSLPLEDSYEGTFAVSLIHLRRKHFFTTKIGFMKEKNSIEDLNIIETKWMFEAGYGRNLFLWKEVVISGFTALRFNRFGLKSYTNNVSTLDEYLLNGESRLVAHPWNIVVGINSTLFQLAGNFSSEIYIGYSVNINSNVNIKTPYNQLLLNADNPFGQIVFGVAIGEWF